MGAIASGLPEWAKRPIRRLTDAVRALPYSWMKRTCPVCGESARRFRPYGVPPRDNAQCPHCGALERHRLLWLYLLRKTDLFDGRPKKMLHVAPEPCLEPRLKKQLGDEYLTADLFDPGAMERMDIANIEYPAEAFDVICCSHVLEHVPDDRQAMRELLRVLKDDGWAILLVPVTSERTLEDPSIVDPGERLKMFGQEDHVRRYGPDVIDRLRDAGFDAERIKVGDLVGRSDAMRMGLTSGTGHVYRCTKRSTTAN